MSGSAAALGDCKRMRPDRRAGFQKRDARAVDKYGALAAIFKLRGSIAGMDASGGAIVSS